MTEKEQLLLIFNNSFDGKKFTVKIDNPKSDLDSVQVEGLMEEIINSGVFGDTLTMDSAQIVKTVVEEFEY